MGRTCTICSHEKRAEIESALVSETPYRNIAERYNIALGSLARHVSDHVQPSIKHVQEANNEVRGLNIIQQLKDINLITHAILKTALADKKPGTALFAIDRVIKQLELQAKLLGVIDTPHINIIVSPEWQQMRTIIISALAPYPDARVAVAGALAGLEVAHAGSV